MNAYTPLGTDGTDKTRVSKVIYARRNSQTTPLAKYFLRVYVDSKTANPTVHLYPATSPEWTGMPPVYNRQTTCLQQTNHLFTGHKALVPIHSHTLLVPYTHSTSNIPAT